MTRLLDQLLGRAPSGRASTYWEGLASGAAIVTQTYGSANREAVLPQFSTWARRAYGNNGIVFAAMLTRMMLLSETEFKWQALDDKHLFGNTDLQLIEQPFGPNSQTGQLVVRMEQDQIFGNAYMWAPPGEDLLVRMRPDWTTIVSELVSVPGGGQYRRKVGYFVQRPTGQRQIGDPSTPDDEGQWYPAKEVSHWAPIPDPDADFRGMSWLTPVMRDIAGDDGMTSYKIKYLENAATPNIMLKYPAKLAPGTIDAIRDRVTARYGSVDNAFKTLVLDQGADMTVVGNNFQQMDFSNVGSAGVERILADAGVPGVLVGLEPLRGAGRGYQESMQKFANLWGRPMWRSLAAALQPVLPPQPAGVRLWYDTSGIAALQDGELERGQAALVNMQALLTARQAGADFDSAIAALTASDWTLLKPAAVPMVAPAGNVQHMLPQAQPGATATPLPASGARIPAGPVSPGDGGDNSRPAPQPVAGRRGMRAITGG